MTRRQPTLTSILLRSVSFEALDHGLAIGSFSQSSSADMALGFLERVRVWLRLVFSGVFGGAMAVQPESCVQAAPINRSIARRRRHKMAITRRPAPLAALIFCQFGLTRCQQWLYDHTLTSRVVWCFKKSFWRGISRRSFAPCAAAILTLQICGAPLRPD